MCVFQKMSDSEPIESTSSEIVKPKKELSDSQLEVLRRARERGNEVRKQRAETKRKEKELANLEAAMKADEINKRYEEVAKETGGKKKPKAKPEPKQKLKPEKYITETESSSDSEEEREREKERRRVAKAKAKKEHKKRTKYYSSSDDDEPPRRQSAPPVDPHELAYLSLFHRAY